MRGGSGRGCQQYLSRNDAQLQPSRPLDNGSCSARGCQSIHAMFLGSYILHTSPRTNITTSTNRTPNGCSYYYYSTKLRAISNNYQAASYRQAGNRQQTTGSIPPSQGITGERGSLLCSMGFDTLYKQAVCHQRDEVSLAKLSISSRTDPCSFRLN